ncbi:MAG: tRNA uridine-5-carboxymethylaminomethyl(34) synthesis enzyme MnmG [Clostridium sp.]|nr:tRNA uridine-5-carboxymethylaminomethyl(34) synthesis enzyme MnmG [Clostridium sp.]MCM1399847.1 tRNA uridine-5-carboxymethylaminomethyl(34) synthesis enzyme MnmG [Clostridium sp.]MCM1460668.1 tRNA uridine-5-carboxymethylaminomethyl(34) synthesis enzyme MnmG [Bacteroides sp.]
MGNTYIEEDYDIAVVGAGHAGCEAALAAARMGFETILFTISMDSIAMMPCNPNIGGSSKGHLVREIDALGGEMGKNIDKTYIQSKMLNVSKGPAVHSLRAQADKVEYTKHMRLTLQCTERLTLRQAEVTELLYEKKDGKKQICGVKTFSGAVYHCKAVILATGTYLKARCIYGDVVNHTGPNGLMAANGLSDSMSEAGIGLRRFKTGTPARLDKKTIDFTKMEEQKGDAQIVPFSFTNQASDIAREQISCWLTYTNEETHKIIKDNIDRSPLFSGFIEGTGPRYCPSIEDKVMKFPDKDRHQIFIEPEGEFTNEMYMGGMSSSLPEDVQYAMIRTVAGLEHVKIIRNAYAIEYDCINAINLNSNLEFKDIDGLFAAGQINGSSGYEEAAAQGLMAGINAARKLQGRDAICLDRSQAYIGVLIDDLVTKETHEPYRMMTSRAEYRLLLRQDNADLRLTDIGHEIGLIDEERYRKFTRKRKLIHDEIARVNSVMIGAGSRTQAFLEGHNSAPLKTAVSLGELIRRPELSYELVRELDTDRDMSVQLDDDIVEQINIAIKYEGYITRQKQQVEQFKKLERKLIPKDINYDEVSNLRKEARQKLSEVRPVSIGQASRISGVSPADVSVLLIYLHSR